MSRYDHVQKGMLWIVLPVLALVCFAMGLAVPEPAGCWTLVGVGALVLLLAASMAWLRVRDEGDRLFVGYGPLPLIRRRIDYARIRGAERVKPPGLLGIGLRWWPRVGWVWNVDTGDLVRLQLGERAFHVGTDDPEGLLALLERRTGRSAQVSAASGGSSSAK